MVAPSMVITGGTWREELEKWSDHPENFTVVPFTQLNTRKVLENGGNKPLKEVKPEYLQAWDAVIVDEAHYTKNASTSWSWAVEQIVKKSGDLLELTGTPMPNWAHESFMVLRSLRPELAKRGAELGAYMGRWVPRWFELSQSPYSSHDQIIGGLRACTYTPSCSQRPADDPCEHWKEFMEVNFGNRFLRRREEDVLDLPPIKTSTVLTPMDAHQKRMYRELKKDYLTNTPSGEELVTWSVGERNVALARLCVAGWMLDQDGPPRGGKFDRLKFDLENRRSQPTLVLAHYRDTVEACKAVAESVGANAEVVHGGVSEKDKARRVQAFKDGKLDVLVGSLETLAEGLTLTVADTAIFVEKSYKPSRNVQAKKRIHRMGQTRSCTVLEYITPDTVDQNKEVLLANKTDQQMRALTAGQLMQLL